jgi:hypothetical protein
MKVTSVQLKNAGVALFSFMLLIVFSTVAYAQSSSTIAQSFKSDKSQGDIVAGALVSTEGTDRTVKLASLSTANRLLGVVDSNPLVSLSAGGQEEEVEVVLSGTTNVLVSDINGTIKSGDRIAVSPINGVGMKATVDSQTIGTAQGAFKQTAIRTVNDREGKRRQIHLGYVQSQINIAAYHTPGSNFLPPFVQDAANSIAGRPVSLMRVLVCSILLILGFITVVILVYTAVRSAMTSLGRNPLAARSIRRGLYQVGAISLIVVGGTLLASYLILTA